MNSKHDKIFGLIGFPLSHSFSKKYFTRKFAQEQLKHHRYELFPIGSIAELPALIRTCPGLCGLNVTIPYKQTVFPFLDTVHPEAEAIGAVNVIKISDKRLQGYNSDVYGFERSLLNFFKQHQTRTEEVQALVLGTGGASKAVAYSLEKLKIPCQLVSRSGRSGAITYEELLPSVLAAHRLVVNTTPLGTFPNVDVCPRLPYEAAGPGHYFYDLVYNPAETLFMKKAKTQGAHVCNGFAMLHLQAERSWEIWNED